MGNSPNTPDSFGPSATPSGSPGRRATLSSDYQRDWPAYFDAVSGKPARDTVLRALQSPGLVPGIAFDIACGEGRDTRAILAHHPAWRILALDASAEGLARLRGSLAASDRARVEIQALAMESIAGRFLSASNVALINASFALPFCRPDAFPGLWAWIVQALGPAGVFAGQFFGDRDEWAPVRRQSHHSRAQVESLLEPFKILHLEEVEKDGDDAMGGAKHHHVFHIVAQRC